jgi:cytochrome c-type biogenesis protein CcmH
VRQEVAAGSSDAQVKADLVNRYGEFILLRPRFSFGNAALWLTPFLVVLLGAGIVLARRRPATTDAEDLSEPEKARLAALTDN